MSANQNDSRLETLRLDSRQVASLSEQGLSTLIGFLDDLDRGREAVESPQRFCDSEIGNSRSSATSPASSCTAELAREFESDLV